VPTVAFSQELYHRVATAFGLKATSTEVATQVAAGSLAILMSLHVCRNIVAAPFALKTDPPAPNVEYFSAPTLMQTIVS
jgi:hypothetical protein